MPPCVGEVCRLACPSFRVVVSSDCVPSVLCGCSCGVRGVPCVPCKCECLHPRVCLLCVRVCEGDRGGRRGRNSPAGARAAVKVADESWRVQCASAVRGCRKRARRRGVRRECNLCVVCCGECVWRRSAKSPPTAIGGGPVRAAWAMYACGMGMHDEESRVCLAASPISQGGLPRGSPKGVSQGGPEEGPSCASGERCPRVSRSESPPSGGFPWEEEKQRGRCRGAEAWRGGPLSYPSAL